MMISPEMFYEEYLKKPLMFENLYFNLEKNYLF